MPVFTQSGDVRFYYTTDAEGILGPAVIHITDADLHRDPGLETTIMILLFSDARAREQDALPVGTKYRSGYWGSLLLGREIGSRIWILNRSVISETNLRHFEQYGKDALQIMVDDGLASSVNVIASRGGQYQVNFLAQIIRPNFNINFKYYINWELQTYGGIE